MRLWSALAVIAVVAVGCAPTPVRPGVYRSKARMTRYTWQCPNGSSAQFPQDTRACLAEAASHYVPRIAGREPQRTLYKDCMEARGYTKIGTASVDGHVEAYAASASDFNSHGGRPFRVTQPPDICPANQHLPSGVMSVDLYDEDVNPCPGCPVAECEPQVH
jgi:hypothetical protein